MAGPENTHEGLLGACARFGAVATPGFSSNHGRTQCSFGGIVGRINAGAMQKRKQPGPFMPQVFGDKTAFEGTDCLQ